MAQDSGTNNLFYGDNPQVLREHIADSSEDLIDLDPPFSSKRPHNLPGKSPNWPAKSGAHVERSDAAPLIGDVGREKTAMGLCITLTERSREMVKEAAAVRQFESPHDGVFRKTQILTIEGWQSGIGRPQFPDLSHGEQTFKKAKKENSGAESKR